MEGIVKFNYVDQTTGLLETGYIIKETGLRFFDYLDLLNFIRNQ